MPLKYNNVIRIKNAYLNFYCSRAKFLIYRGITNVNHWKIWFLLFCSRQTTYMKTLIYIKIDFNSCLWQYLYISLTIYVGSGNNYFMACINCLYIRENLFCNATVYYIRVKRRCPLNLSKVTSTIVIIPHKINMSHIRKEEITINV